MQLNKGFVGFSILIAIVLGLIVIGGGTYFVMQKNSPSPTLSDNTLDNSQTLPTTNSQTQTTQQPNTQTSATAPSTGGFQPLGLGQTIGAATAGYTRDAAGIYTLGLNGRGPKVTGADSNTFEVNTAWPIYARDNTHVYVYGEVISGADPKTFVAVCGYSMQLESFCAYGKDTKSVYAYTQVVPNANSATFVSLLSNNDTNKNNAGKSWIGGAIDASAYYGGYVPSQYGDLSSKLSGVRVSKLSDGTSIHFSDTSKVVAINLNTSSWGGYYEGVKVGLKSYYGGTYLVDGASVYTLYSACDVDASGKESNCTPKISRVGKIGDKPTEVASQSGSAIKFNATAGATFTLAMGQTASDGTGGITVKLKSVTGGQHPSTIVNVVSASSTVEAGLAETAKIWGLTQDEYVPGSGVGSELIWSAKWGYSSWPDTNSPTGSVRLKVIVIDPVAQTVTFQVNTDPVPPERG